MNIQISLYYSSKVAQTQGDYWSSKLCPRGAAPCSRVAESVSILQALPRSQLFNSSGNMYRYYHLCSVRMLNIERFKCFHMHWLYVQLYQPSS